MQKRYMSKFFNQRKEHTSNLLAARSKEKLQGSQHKDHQYLQECSLQDLDIGKSSECAMIIQYDM